MVCIKKKTKKNNNDLNWMGSKTQRRFSCLCTDVMSKDPCVYPIYQYTMPTSLVFQLESGPFLIEGIGSKKFADRGELETLAPT